MIEKPLLAPRQDPMSYKPYFQELQYPYLVSPKFDGIRGIVRKNHVLSRTMNVLRSYQVQEEFSGLSGLDGELVIGDPTSSGCYNLCQSHIMSFDKPHEDLRYYIFDCFNDTSKPFWRRLEEAEKLVQQAALPNLFFVKHDIAENYEDLIEIEGRYLAAGYEGVMLRNPLALYKQNRATFKDNIIYKLKRFSDDEGLVVGFEEGMDNNNVQERDERGYSKRSKAKEGLTGSGMLGKFLVRWNNLALLIAPGNFTHAERKYIWENQDQFRGRLLKFRYFGYGIKDLPRFPRALGFRDPMDM